MKIGIITWFRGSNYGTNLQAIALQQYLRKEGHAVRIINYQVPESGKKKRPFWERVAYQPQKYVAKYAARRFHREIELRDDRLRKAVDQHCVLTQEINSEQALVDVCNTFDLLICGSDQIWNPNWYHRFYFADYDEIHTRKIAYAPSLGVNELPLCSVENIKRGVRKFSVVSVREEQGAKLLAPFLDTPPSVVVDPTLLLNADEWNAIFPGKTPDSPGEYILSMFLTDKTAHWQAAQRFAKEKGLRHVIIPYCGFSYLQKGTVYADAGLEELLAVLRNAEYVLTDSFHITVFSLIYRRQFYTFQRFQENATTSTNARIRNLLRLAGLDNRLLTYGTSRIREQENIDYAVCSRALDEAIDESRRCLKNTVADHVE